MPLTFLAAVVEIQHGSNSIYSEAINLIVVQPVLRSAKQKTGDFPATIVVDTGTPIWMFATLWMIVFIKVGAIEFGKSMTIRWKVCRYPIKQDSKFIAMRAFNKAPKALSFPNL